MSKTSESRRSSEVRWLDVDGRAISCTEKIKVLDENFDELRQLAQDTLDDAVLLGCTEASMKLVIHRLIDSLSFSLD